MKTEPKEILHLYLGCEMVTEKGNIFKLEPHHFPSNWQEEYIFNKAKPLLRPLSDIKETEIVEMFNLNETSGVYVFRVDNENTHRFTSKQFLYLLKQGFDLFQLIENGYAIDKSKT